MSFEFFNTCITLTLFEDVLIHLLSVLLFLLCREENEIVPQVIQAILAMPESTHIAVRHTSIQLLGELAEWIDNHGQLLGENFH